MRRLLYIIMCLTCSMLARAQSTYQYRYWFDNDSRNAKTETGNASHSLSVDLAGLSESLHTLHVQVVDSDGVASAPQSRMFVKSRVTGEGALRYWFDENYADAVTIAGNNIAAEIGLDKLADGLHMLHVQNIGIAPSAPRSTYFLKLPQVEGVETMRFVAAVDGEIYKQEDVPTSAGAMHYDLDATDLKEGLHLLTMLVVTKSGAASSAISRYFLRVNTENEIADMKCHYSIDGGKSKELSGTYNSGAFHFDLDVADLSNGLHNITYMLATESGTATSMRNAFFVKIPLGGNGISAYEYWVNTEYGDHTRVELEKHVTKYELMSMLPVPSVPIRSSDFHFEFTDGKPFIYAQNDFHIRFYEASGRFTDECKSYTDYHTAQEIRNAELLVSGEPAVKDKPTENEIQWYHFPAHEGDSLSFKVDRACTVQVFDPTGEEVYKASGSEIVKWGGIHAWEDGEYYLALHDVTAQQGTNTKLEYQHIDKYAILAYDVHRVGNGGMSTITFNGNGFKNLYAVDLINGSTTVKHIDIGHESDATTSVSFDFEDAPLGQYKAVFHFVDEDRTIDNMLEVEEQKDLNLIATISYPSTFLRGSSTTYTVNITNTGNSTAYAVPIELKLIVNSIENIQHLKFSGDIKSLSEPDHSIFDDMDKEDIDMIREIANNANDLSQFVIVHDSIEGKDYGLAHIFVNIAPNSTLKFNVTIKSTDTVNLFAYTNSEWFPMIMQDYSNVVALKVKSRAAKNNLCCYKERIQCGVEIVAKIIGLNPAWKCGSCVASATMNTTLDFICAEGNNTKDKFSDFVQKNGASVVNRIIGCAIDCITGHFKIQKKSLMDQRFNAAKAGNTQEVLRLNNEIQECRKALDNAINSVYNMVSTFVGSECAEAFKEKKPNCPPKPVPGGGGSTPRNPVDPNDITGYTAESGSHFVKKDLVDVNYKIEFENDTAFATASAHTVVIKDTLDSRLFDLASFAPTSVKIGEKMVELDGTPNFVKTIDMRPEIYAIAQVEGSLDKQKGIATWTFTSLDPMTMESTDDVMSGFLPVNYDGRGQGEVTFDIKRRNSLIDGAVIPNRASIVFDNEDAIMTPTWKNAVDLVAPMSRIADAVVSGDSITLYFEGSDEGSGVWKYDVYQLAGDAEKWRKVADGVTADSCRVRYYEGFDYNFCVVATDSAGNVEDKELSTLPTFYCDLQLKAGWNWISSFLGKPQPVAGMFGRGASRVVSQTHETLVDPEFGMVGGICDLMPGTGYKVNATRDFIMTYAGLLQNLDDSPVVLRKGWNWIGYPYYESRAIETAVVNAEEGDFVVAQGGFTEFADGAWGGSIERFDAGQGYLYKSVSDKTLQFDFAEQAARVKAATDDGSESNVHGSETLADGSAYSVHGSLSKTKSTGLDIHKYPNTMNVTARLWRDGAVVTDGRYVVKAFSDSELRGEGVCVNGTHYVTVYGDKAVEIAFVVEDTETGEQFSVAETLAFTSDVVGSRKSPFALTMGEATGIADVKASKGAADIYTVSGVKVQRASRPGVYVVNGRKVVVR